MFFFLYEVDICHVIPIIFALVLNCCEKCLNKYHITYALYPLLDNVSVYGNSINVMRKLSINTPKNLPRH